MRFLIFLPILALWSCAPAPVLPPAEQAPQVTPPITQPETAPVPIKEPEVTLRNFTAKDIVLELKFSNQERPKMYSLPSRSKRKISIAAGEYEWAATAEKTPVQKGTKAFTSGQTYLWDFNLD